MKKIITIIKSKLLTLLLLMITTIAIKGQEFHVETPGTLQEVIGDGAEDLRPQLRHEPLLHRRLRPLPRQAQGGG